MSYRQSGFPVATKKGKFTGFEEVKDHYDRLDKKSYGRAFNDRYRTPLEKLNPLPKVHYHIVPEDMLSHPEQTQRLNEMYGKELALPDMDPSLLFEKVKISK